MTLQFLQFLSRKIKTCSRTSAVIIFTLLCERKSEFTSLRIGQILFVSPNVKAMPVNMANVQTPLLDHRYILSNFNI